jgi:hypothetical protein
MRSQLIGRGRPSTVLAGIVLLTSIGRCSYGQTPDPGEKPAPKLAQSPQSSVQPMIPGTVPSPYLPQPTTPETEVTAPATPSEEIIPPATSPGSMFESVLGDRPFAALGGQTVAIADNAGYIDSAIIRSRFRMRYDSAYNLNSPDRAEYFYAKCGCFNFAPLLNTPGVVGYKSIYDPRASGPLRPLQSGAVHPGHAYAGEPRVNYQVAAPYFEYAVDRWTSLFIETPARFNNFQLPIVINNPAAFHYNTYGWSDMNLGFKRALIAEPNRFYTFQLRTYVPTGSGQKGLGTDHASLEPGFLVFQRLTDRLYFSGELIDWIPVNATNFAGNIITYGAGLAYNIVLTQHARVAPVVEFVGWSVLGGKQLEPNAAYDPTKLPPGTAVDFTKSYGAPEKVVSAGGDTIVNGKFGLRFGLGNYGQPGGGSALNDRHSLYVGYGQTLTGDHWYKNMFRVEYNFWF